MSSTSQDRQSLEQLRSATEQFLEGPPHELFAAALGVPVHWSDASRSIQTRGFWSVTRADDVHEVSRDWQTFSSELAASRTRTPASLEMQAAMFIGMTRPSTTV